MFPTLKLKNSPHDKFRHVGRASIIYLKERNLQMLTNDLIQRNPLRLMGRDADEILSPGEFGAILARAGVGKTALLVQIALNTLLSGKNVLHVSLNDPVDKVSLWYREVFGNLSKTYDVRQIEQLWESLLPHRLIMTFKVEGFSVPKLEERLADLSEQGIFTPDMVIIDGLPFDESTSASLNELKGFSSLHGIQSWFTVRTHRHESTGSDGLPATFAPIQELFSVILQLEPTGQEIHVRALKGESGAGGKLPVKLDPATMLLQDSTSRS
jgi:hypothetical protein